MNTGENFKRGLIQVKLIDFWENAGYTGSHFIQNSMNLTIFLVLLFSLQLFYWLVGFLASRKVASQEDYFLAGKQVRFFPLMMTFLATQVGGGLVLGAAEEAFSFGWSVLLYPLGAALGLILLGSGMGKRLARFPVSTVAQIFEVFYGSKFLKSIASCLSIVSLFLILVAQIVASSKFVVSLGVTSTPLFIIFWGVVILYTVRGGLKALISTDIVQALVFASVFLGTFTLILCKGASLPPLPVWEWTSGSVNLSKLCGWFFMPLLFMVIEQDMGQRCFAGESGKVVSRASLCAGIATLTICVVPVFFGVWGKQMGIEIQPGGSVLMAVISKMTSPWISALVGCAVLAAIISTATSLMNAISSNLASDFSWKGKGKNLSFAQWITGGICVSALLVAFFCNQIVALLILSYELSVSCLFVPICMALFLKRGSVASAAISLSFGALGFVLFRVYPIPFPKEIMSVIMSLIGYVLTERWLRRQTKVSLEA